MGVAFIDEPSRGVLIWPESQRRWYSWNLYLGYIYIYRGWWIIRGDVIKFFFSRFAHDTIDDDTTFVFLFGWTNNIIALIS